MSELNFTKIYITTQALTETMMRNISFNYTDWLLDVGLWICNGSGYAFLRYIMFQYNLRTANSVSGVFLGSDDRTLACNSKCVGFGSHRVNSIFGYK